MKNKIPNSIPRK
ncbi:hypothetical protein D030_1189A, partial [Vibrio parahaemolyticus AQ3810]